MQTTTRWVQRTAVTVGLIVVGGVAHLAIWAFLLHDLHEDIDLARWVAPGTAGTSR